MNYYTDVLKKYADFSGRARRQEYWMFFLCNLAVAIVVAIIDAVIGANMIIYGLYVLAIIVPCIALTVRRLHDLGKSGWWCFIVFIPLVGGIWLIVLAATEGQPGPNQYGPSPKAVHA
ncbi:DUF805 domain-containing protein [Streptomyces sp. ISL-94]|uniref:DUF805 domain-containing protein n=1 Tax=Streptomyces sp. ISL-94 TaxID=2819190 RepID=UPI001BECFED9|nr:DUF805 domain-containing protein [Streptomyces sp. ISL-94]MBT2481415.1 DUF805 domain-containing protein [Streptomyces sp. ISL-94]